MQREGRALSKLGFYRDSAVMTVHNLFVIANPAVARSALAAFFSAPESREGLWMSSGAIPIPSVTEITASVSSIDTVSNNMTPVVGIANGLAQQIGQGF